MTPPLYFPTTCRGLFVIGGVALIVVAADAGIHLYRDARERRRAGRMLAEHRAQLQQQEAIVQHAEVTAQQRAAALPPPPRSS